MEHTTPELLPCPFCGAHDEGIGLCMGPAPQEWFVRCYVCHVETCREDTGALAVSRWNLRAAPPAPEAVPALTDRGPWFAQKWPDGRVVLQSHQFDHDAALIVDGDFADAEQRMRYAEGLAEQINAALPVNDLRPCRCGALVGNCNCEAMNPPSQPFLAKGEKPEDAQSDRCEARVAVSASSEPDQSDHIADAGKAMPAHQLSRNSGLLIEARMLAAALVAWRNATPEEWAAEPDKLRAILDNASRALVASPSTSPLSAPASPWTAAEIDRLWEEVKLAGPSIPHRTFARTLLAAAPESIPVPTRVGEHNGGDYDMTHRAHGVNPSGEKR